MLTIPRSRNIALFSAVTIATATMVMFRYGMFRSKEITVLPSERKTMHGEEDPSLQTDQGTTKAARGPKNWFNPFGKE